MNRRNKTDKEEKLRMKRKNRTDEEKEEDG